MDADDSITSVFRASASGLFSLSGLDLTSATDILRIQPYMRYWSERQQIKIALVNILHSGVHYLAESARLGPHAARDQRLNDVLTKRYESFYEDYKTLFNAVMFTKYDKKVNNGDSQITAAQQEAIDLWYEIFGKHQIQT